MRSAGAEIWTEDVAAICHRYASLAPPIVPKLGEMVRQSVEQILNGLLDAEADRLCSAGDANTS